MGKAPLPVPTEATELMRLHRIAQDRRGDLPRSMDKREIHLKAFARWLAPSGLFDGQDRGPAGVPLELRG
jgi:hypothetical protein